MKTIYQILLYLEEIKLRLENWALWGVKEFQDGFRKIEKSKNIGHIREIGKIINE